MQSKLVHRTIIVHIYFSKTDL
ncbi:hypothetical protein BGLA2_1090018 [Burkholderia gladioli]|nr:hypothetical protein BGLA2_1090018 [Burkholderia gladioli]